ncbi:hypothetical protein SDC9_157490 [bioreactor metagenome]|uniref:Uncharacterized protein n=1 Tax=bioreactor metagenome TaxID=1076179 RepID=A0A645F741_9ZZZZ
MIFICIPFRFLADTIRGFQKENIYAERSARHEGKGYYEQPRNHGTTGSDGEAGGRQDDRASCGRGSHRGSGYRGRHDHRPGYRDKGHIKKRRSDHGEGAGLYER